jgi:hypothetical protein
MLHKKSNKEIHAKLSIGYGKDALCQRTVDTRAARFRSRGTSLEDHDRFGRPSRDDFSPAISGHLKRNIRASCCDIVKDLFVPMTTISQVLDEIGSRFIITRWVPHELSVKSKANRVDIYQEMSEVLEKPDPQQKNHVITGDKYWIYWDNYHHG